MCTLEYAPQFSLSFSLSRVVSAYPFGRALVGVTAHSCSQVLIASENFTSKSVFDSLGSVLSNKYSEGYPRARGHAVYWFSTFCVVGPRSRSFAELGWLRA